MTRPRIMIRRGLVRLCKHDCLLRHSVRSSQSACVGRRNKCTASEPPTLLQHLQARIRGNGPITVAQYMKEVLTNPVSGYYMHQDVFGQAGDFITSPEISQMFGELIGIWCVNEWMQSGSPKQIQVVELGPGRGTLASDMLRVFSQFPEMRESVSLHLVEISPKLSTMQYEKLCGTPLIYSEDSDTDSGRYRTGRSQYGPPVSWYRELAHVPEGFSFYIAHEFFDALPIHKFHKKDGRWREILVNTDSSGSGLQFALAQGDTAASKILLQVPEDDKRQHIELCPEAGIIVQDIASRVQDHGGCALFADYGHDGEKEDTFRAFKEHKLHDPLLEPGSADLTADVDFSYFKKLLKDHVTIHGPITQQTFLYNMGIKLRLQMLMTHADAETRKSLVSGYEMLTNPEQMGERFKFFSFHQHRDDSYKPAGFVEPQ